MYADPRAPTVAIVPTATVPMPASAPAAAAPAIFKPFKPLVAFLLEPSVSSISSFALSVSFVSLSSVLLRFWAFNAPFASEVSADFASTFKTYCTTVSAIS